MERPRRDRPFVDPDPTSLSDAPDRDDEAAWEAMRSLPEQEARPLRWDPRAGRFLEEAAGGASGSARTPRAETPPPPPSVPRVRIDDRPAPPRPRRAPSAPPAGPDATAVLPGAAAPAPPRVAPGRTAGPAPGGVPASRRVERPVPRPAQQPVTGRTGRGGPPGPPRPPEARRGGARPPAGRRRSMRRRALVVLAVLLALVVVGPLAFSWWQFSRLERVEVGSSLSSGGGGTNYLIVGSDSREGIAEDDPNAGAFLGTTVTGRRADTLIVLRVGDGGARMLSIPRDLWVTDPATGEPGRINSTYAAGPSNLIDVVTGLGIPVHRYMEIDFVSFAGMVDAVGGITIEVPNPARDPASGLDLPEAGTVRLDGAQALAYVRSRQYTELVGGQWVTDPTGDLGRVQRQRTFLTALLGEVGGARNPFTVRAVADALGPGLRVDDEMTFPDALRLAWDARGMSPESVDLPVVGRTTSGGASVLELVQPDAEAVIASFAGSG